MSAARMAVTSGSSFGGTLQVTIQEFCDIKRIAIGSDPMAEARQVAEIIGANDDEIVGKQFDIVVVETITRRITPNNAREISRPASGCDNSPRDGSVFGREKKD